MLTERQIRALKPREKDYVTSDGRGARGEGVLVLKVRPSGTKEFYFQRHVAGAKKLTKLGNWPALSLTQARDRCRAEAEVVVSAGTFQELLSAYVAKLEGEGAASAANVAWSFRHYVSEPFPELVRRPAALVGPAQIRDILSRMIDQGVTTYCNRLRSQLHAAFQVGLEQEYNPRSYLQVKVRFGLQSNPVASIPVQEDWEQPGDRALSKAELRTLWQLLPEQLSLTTAELIRFLIAAGGQRPEQLLASERALYQDDHLVIRSTKGRVQGERQLHVVPFNAPMRQVLQTMAEIDANGAYPFQGRVPGQPLNVQSLSRAVTNLYRRHAAEFTAPFTLRDLRRTCKTLMASAGLSKELRDRIQGHAFNDVSSKHYDRYDYFAEKRAGLETWADWLEKHIIH
ncbi:tyrosine-type recombinase/integrase [Pseudomonas oryzihabitans]|uniref:tyrosine-type recombinase/integrase n=1 Tax=Pseudomonas oryzihabitans TaxID=47885 RepID=UPI0011245960|nr:integrase arm-type DNA-binding domain-containing protein [Pseudomonas psychrotolerans]QDD91300.1 integrase [Pseudomonas psychrotolerans]